MTACDFSCRGAGSLTSSALWFLAGDYSGSNTFEAFFAILSPGRCGLGTYPWETSSESLKSAK